MVEVYLFRVTKNLLGLVIEIVSQQSEKDIFTRVVLFCKAAFFIAVKYFTEGFFYEEKQKNLSGNARRAYGWRGCNGNGFV